jgi:hypothetical protein
VEPRDPRSAMRTIKDDPSTPRPPSTSSCGSVAADFQPWRLKSAVKRAWRTLSAYAADCEYWYQAVSPAWYDGGQGDWKVGRYAKRLARLCCAHLYRLDLTHTSTTSSSHPHCAPASPRVTSHMPDRAARLCMRFPSLREHGEVHSKTIAACLHRS